MKMLKETMAPRRYRRKNNRKKKQTAKPRTKVDKRLSRRISKLENSVEMKYIDSSTSGLMDTAGQTFSVISNMSDGDNYNQRVGNQVTAKKVFIQYRIYSPPQFTPTQVRMIFYWDLQFNGGVGAQLFTGGSPTPLELSTALLDDRGGMVSMNVPYNQNTRQRFKILYDVVHTLNPKDIVVGTASASVMVETVV